MEESVLERGRILNSNTLNVVPFSPPQSARSVPPVENPLPPLPLPERAERSPLRSLGRGARSGRSGGGADRR